MSVKEFTSDANLAITSYLQTFCVSTISATGSALLYHHATQLSKKMGLEDVFDLPFIHLVSNQDELFASSTLSSSIAIGFFAGLYLLGKLYTTFKDANTITVLDTNKKEIVQTSPSFTGLKKIFASYDDGQINYKLNETSAIIYITDDGGTRELSIPFQAQTKSIEETLMYE